MHTKSIFVRRGIPKIVVSDNGPQFSSKQYQVFAKHWEFQHITSSPKHPQTNGKAERTVQTVKQLLKKAMQNDEDPYLALLNFRACPASDESPAPASKLMNRKLRTRLPAIAEENTALSNATTNANMQKVYYSVHMTEAQNLYKNCRKVQPYESEISKTGTQKAKLCVNY